MINVLDTGAPDDGSDVLIVNGYDNAQRGYDSGTARAATTHVPDRRHLPAPPLELHRRDADVDRQANEIADDPAFVALLHGNFGTARRSPHDGRPRRSATRPATGCEVGQTLTATAGSVHVANGFVAGRRIHLGMLGDAGVWAGDYTIQSVGADGTTSSSPRRCRPASR